MKVRDDRIRLQGFWTGGKGDSHRRPGALFGPSIFLALLFFGAPILFGWPQRARSQVPHTPTLPGIPNTPFPYASPEEVGLSQEALNPLRDMVRGWLEEDEVVGAEVLLLKDRKIVLHETFGWRDRDRGQPLERNSIYRIRSMTKPFTGTAVLLLMEEGLLALDDPVSDYLPSWRNERSSGVTLRQLLTHTAGFVQGGFPSPFWSYSSLREAVDAVGRMGPQHTPGERYEYSDLGSATLGAVVAEVSGMPLEEFIQSRILTPLGLNDTHPFFDPELPWASRMNPTYSRSGEGSPWRQYWNPDQAQEFPFFRASGGLYSTSLDYVRWLTVFMDMGVYSQGRLLSSETILDALQAHAVQGYGLHWEIFSQKTAPGALPAFGHGGSDGTLAVAFPSEDAVAVVFTQSRGARVLRAFPPAVWGVLRGGGEGQS